jgi:hypothetical protein
MRGRHPRASAPRARTRLRGCVALVLCLGLAGMASARTGLGGSRLHSSATGHKTEAKAPALRAPEGEAGMIAALGPRVVSDASLYETFVRRASTIDPRFRNALAVRNALRAGSAYSPEQLQTGVVAYAAMLALRNRDFVSGVRALRGTRFADRLAAWPGAIMYVRGADQAAWDVASVLDAQGAALLTSGRAITRAAYDVQHQPWSTVRVADQVQVLAETEDAGAQLRTADARLEKLLLASVMSAPRTAAPRSSYAGPEVVHGLALAALTVLGRTSDEDVGNTSYLANCAECLNLARMNLNQCLAAAGPSYEDAFCLGRYAIDETTLCIKSAVDGRARLAVAPRRRLETTLF